LHERFVEGAFFWVADNLVVNLGWNSFQNNLREHDLLLDALAHESGCLLDIDGESTKPRQPIVIVLNALKEQGVG
jgi:hypothetical protein